ncbi:unnamed protein product [Caenorhabditis bovis]|uniref:RNA polymerase II assembly factor Rtp1 C-terminal domain-containing protein n=1 Tax=Caenorhabditis bovis TaxID=2654633 RepID=A0A8S1EJX3_9PELO|nr:unnamed protein product [Caenorhabditis bovis]
MSLSHIHDGITEDESIASTSKQNASSLNSDARHAYSQVLGKIYNELARCLRSEKDVEEDEYRILSLQNIGIISDSFQFFVLTALLPYFENGVGIGASNRSSFVRSWKLFDGNIKEQRDRLSFAVNVICELFGSNEALRVQLLKKFVDDILCVKFQLESLGVSTFHENLDVILKDCSKDLLISALMGLCRPKIGKIVPPIWLQKSCGAMLSSILVEINGLSYFVAYYADVGGSNWTDNVPVRTSFARQITRVPQSASSSLAYHSTIYRQFKQILAQQDPDDPESKKIAKLLASFVGEMGEKYKRNANLVVFDDLLRFWEILNEKRNELTSRIEQIDLPDNFETSLNILFMLSELDETNVMISPRFLNLTATFLDIYDESEDMDEGIMKKLQKILKFSLKNVSNKGSLIYCYIMNPSRHVRILKPIKSKLIEEIGEEKKSRKTEDVKLVVEGIEEADLGVARRLESASMIIQKYFFDESCKIFLEILAEGVNDWFSLSLSKESDQYSPRFVDDLNNKDRSRNDAHAHLVVGFCFEQIVEIMSGGKGFENSSDQLVLLLRIVQTILIRTAEKFENFKIKSEKFDLFKVSHEDLSAIEIMTETCKMCIGLIGGVLFAANMYPNLMEELEKTLKCVETFTKSSQKCCEFDEFGEDLAKVVKDARDLLDIMNYDVKEEPEKANIQSKPSTSKGTTDEIGEILRCLRDEYEESAMKGATLIQISRIFRSNQSEKAKKLLEHEIFSIVSDLIMDRDSYVYLAAINCLCEIACYDRKYLQEIINLYFAMNQKEKTCEDDTIRRGRMGEALGKVFRIFGEVSILYLDEIARMFTQTMREDEEIIRASCCCALGDIIVACRGRGIEKYLDEMLYTLETVILADKSCLVRRAAVDLVRQCIRSCSTDVLQIMGGRLRDIRRKVTTLWKYDRDEVVRLHAQLCIEELNAAIIDIFEEESSHYCRQIKI